MSSPVNWHTCQTHSTQILAEGLFNLQACPPHLHDHVGCSLPGNYLITLNDDPVYIGEAKNVSARMRQQFRKNTSTFYKNYLKSQPMHPSEVNSFRVQYMRTTIGRKEIEDFGISNLPNMLNRFQLGKRKIAPAATCDIEWLELQTRSSEILAEAETEFLSAPLSPMLEAQVPVCAGLYSVWNHDNGQLIYIGESSDIAKRHATHCRQTYFSALRRNLGASILGLSLKTKNGRKRYFNESEDLLVTDYLRSCQFTFMPVALGRIEIEEHLIHKHQPLLNRKGNRPVVDRALTE